MSTVQVLIGSRFDNSGVKKAEAEVRRLMTGLNDIMKGAQGSQIMPITSFAAQTAGLQKMTAAFHQNLAVVRKAATEYRRLAVEQFALGDMGKGMALDSTASQMENVAGTMERLSGITEETGQKFNIAKTAIAKFAFGLFVVQGTIHTVARELERMVTFVSEGAASFDRVRGFGAIMESMGVDAQAMGQKLREASQGTLTLADSIEPVLLLLKAGLPDAAAEADKILAIATNAAIVSGDLNDLDRIYRTLIQGIVRGQPLLIDNAGILLKVSDAYEKFAIKIDSTVDALSTADKKMAVLDAVKEWGPNMEALANATDSVSLRMQQRATDVKEAWEIFKQAFAIIVDEVLTRAGEVIAFMKLLRKTFTGGGDEMSEAMKKAFDTRPITSFVTILAVGALGIKGVLIGLSKELEDLWMVLIKMIEVLPLVGQAMEHLANKEWSLALEDAKAAMTGVNDAALDALNPTNHLQEELNNVGEQAKVLAQDLLGLAPALGDVATASDNAADAGKRLQDQLADQLGGLSNAINASIEARTGIDAQYSEKRQDINKDLSEKLQDIEQDLSEKLVDINRDLRERLVDIANDYRKSVADANEDVAEDLLKIDEKLAEDLAKAAEGAAEKREDAVKDKNKAVEKAVEDHQKKLNDIERRYQMARMKALIDRDARGLFEAEQARKDALDEAGDDLDDSIEDEKEKLEEKLEDINDAEEKRRKDAIKNAEKRRKDAVDAHNKELADLKENFREQSAEATKNAAKQRADAKRSASEKRRDAKDAQGDAIRDLNEWYREQQILQQEANLQEKLRQAEHLAEMGELTQEHLNDLRGMYTDYQNDVASIGGSVPGGGGGGGGYDPYFDPDGISGLDPGSDTGYDGGSGTTFDPFENSGWPYGGGNMTLNINSNDKLLEDVLKSGTYEAIIEANTP